MDPAIIMNQGGIEALAAATCVGIATNIEQSFSISTLPHLSIRGRATPSIMLTFYSYHHRSESCNTTHQYGNRTPL